MKRQVLMSEDVAAILDAGEDEAPAPVDEPPAP